MNIYSMTIEAREEEINNSLNVYLGYLYNHDYLTEEQFRDLSLNTAVLIKKPSFFHRMWIKLGWKDQTVYTVVRQYSMEEDDENSSSED